MTKLRPCASAKWAPTSESMSPSKVLYSSMVWRSTLIGFWPRLRRSSTPGVPTYLQTNTLCGDDASLTSEASAADGRMSVEPARLRVARRGMAMMVRLWLRIEFTRDSSG